MEELKFKTKIKKLIDVKSKLEEIMKEISREKLIQQDHFLGEVIFEISSVLVDLEEFKAFHVHDIIQKVLEVLHNVKGKVTSLSKNLYQVLFHLLQVGYQQVLLLQDVIENKMIAQKSMEILDQELGRNNKFLDMIRKPIELPSLTFRNVDIHEAKGKALNDVPTNRNLSIDTEKFDQLMNNYKQMIRYKNLLVLSENNHFVGLYKHINSFSQMYEQLNLVPINNLMDQVIDDVTQYIEHKEIELMIKTYWGKSRFPYFKLELLENFTQNTLELLIDYLDLSSEDGKTFEIKTNTINSFLTITIRSRFFNLEFENKAKKGDDNRLNYFFETLEKLDANYQIESLDNVVSVFKISIPLRSDVYSAYFTTFNNKNYFILEDDVESFNLVSHKKIVFNNDLPSYQKDQQQIPIVNYHESYEDFKDQYIVFCKINTLLVAIIVDEIHNKEQVVMEDGLIEYKGQRVPVLKGNNLYDLNISMIESKEPA